MRLGGRAVAVASPPDPQGVQRLRVLFLRGRRLTAVLSHVEPLSERAEAQEGTPILSPVLRAVAETLVFPLEDHPEPEPNEVWTRWRNVVQSFELGEAGTTTELKLVARQSARAAFLSARLNDEIKLALIIVQSYLLTGEGTSADLDDFRDAEHLARRLHRTLAESHTLELEPGLEAFTTDVPAMIRDSGDRQGSSQDRAAAPPFAAVRFGRSPALSSQD